MTAPSSYTRELGDLQRGTHMLRLALARAAAEEQRGGAAGAAIVVAYEQTLKLQLGVFRLQRSAPPPEVSLEIGDAR